MAKPSLNVEALERGLASHPDKFFVSKIIYDAINGVSIGYDGPRKFREHDNWPSAYKYKDAVTASIEKDVSIRCKAGPFDHPPFTNLEYIMLQTGVTHVFHYLDDFITFGETVNECQGNLDVMLETCKTVGFDVNPEKVVDATPVLATPSYFVF